MGEGLDELVDDEGAAMGHELGVVWVKEDGQALVDAGEGDVEELVEGPVGAGGELLEDGGGLWALEAEDGDGTGGVGGGEEDVGGLSCHGFTRDGERNRQEVGTWVFLWGIGR